MPVTTFFLLFFTLNLAFAQVGQITSTEGSDAEIIRDEKTLKVMKGTNLFPGDRISTKSGILGFYLFPSTQVKLNKNTKVGIVTHNLGNGEKNEGVETKLQFLEGSLILRTDKFKRVKFNQTIEAQDVSFSTNGASIYETYYDKDAVNLLVQKGEVTVSSPHVQTFVPEIVKANEGFSFIADKKLFLRKKVSGQFPLNPSFEKFSRLQRRWKKLKK